MFESPVGRVVRAGLFVGCGLSLMRLLGMFRHPVAWLVVVVILGLIGSMVPKDDHELYTMMTQVSRDSVDSCKIDVMVQNGDPKKAAHYCICIVHTDNVSDDSSKSIEEQYKHCYIPEVSPYHRQ